MIVISSPRVIELKAENEVEHKLLDLLASEGIKAFWSFAEPDNLMLEPDVNWVR